MRKDNNAGIENILRQDNSSAAKILLETIQNTKKMGLAFEDSLYIAISEERLRLESRISILGTLGNNAPFIGLFGTVLGIINAFHSLAQNTKGGPTIIMTGDLRSPDCHGAGVIYRHTRGGGRIIILSAGSRK